MSRRRVAWPTLRQGGVPEDDVAVALAEQVREAVLGSDNRDQPLGDMRPFLRRGRFRLSVERMSAADGGMEACLVPDADDRFDIVVDPEPRGGWRPHHKELRTEIQRHRLRFRTGHEAAHSFFFHRAPGRVPRRRVQDSAEQERFCDVFAGALLLPPSVVARTSPTPDEIMRMQERYDVSLQLAVRMFADMHPRRSFVLLYTDAEPPFVRPQWATRRQDWLPRWWATDAIQSLASRDAHAVVVPHKSGRRSRLRAMWLPRRRQALLVGR